MGVSHMFKEMLKHIPMSHRSSLPKVVLKSLRDGGDGGIEGCLPSR